MKFSDWLKLPEANQGSISNRNRTTSHPNVSDCYREPKQVKEYIHSRKRLILAARSRIASELDQAERWVAQLHCRGSDDMDMFLRDAKELLYRMQKIGGQP